MGIKTNLQILAEITGKILTGGRRTTAVNTRSVLTDLADSSLNKKDGGLVVEALTGYATDLTPTDDNHFTNKKYVDDNSGSVPDATESVKGKVELVSDAEFEENTPADTTGYGPPTQEALVLTTRHLGMLWLKIVDLFDTFLDYIASTYVTFSYLATNYYNKTDSDTEYKITNSFDTSNQLYSIRQDGVHYPLLNCVSYKMSTYFGVVVGPLGRRLVASTNDATLFHLYNDTVDTYTMYPTNAIGGTINGLSSVLLPPRYMIIFRNGDGTNQPAIIQSTASGSGDVVGPASSANNNVVFFDGTTGKLIKDSGLSLSGSNTGDETTATIKSKLGVASVSQDGYLSSTDWNTFNNKQNAIGYTPENQANKATTMTGNTASNVLYLTAKAVYDWGIATFQAINNNLTAIAGLATAANKMIYWTGSGTASTTDLTAFARSILDDADAMATRQTIGVWPIAFFGSTLASGTGGATQSVSANTLLVNPILGYNKTFNSFGFGVSVLPTPGTKCSACLFEVNTATGVETVVTQDSGEITINATGNTFITFPNTTLDSGKLYVVGIVFDNALTLSRNNSTYNQLLPSNTSSTGGYVGGYSRAFTYATTITSSTWNAAASNPLFYLWNQI